MQKQHMASSTTLKTENSTVEKKNPGTIPLTAKVTTRLVEKDCCKRNRGTPQLKPEEINGGWGTPKTQRAGTYKECYEKLPSGKLGNP